MAKDEQLLKEPQKEPVQLGCRYKYSVILPVYNEESCIKDILLRIDSSLSPLGEPFEIICVDDGSQDNSWPIICQFHQDKPYIKGVKFSRNFGHQLAYYAGIKYCQGDLIAVLDSDGQDPPELLPELFKKCEEGYDVVYAIRKSRTEGFFKRAAYKLFYRFFKFLSPFDVPLDSGDFAVFTKRVGTFISSLDEKTPFIRGLRSWFGGKQTQFEYDRQERISGKPKYTFSKLVLLAVNASISFSKMPLRMISLLGIFISLLSFIFGVFQLVKKLTVGIDPVGWTSTIMLIAFLGGVNLFVLGIIGEYIGNIFDEVKNRPAFLIDQTRGFNEQ